MGQNNFVHCGSNVLEPWLGMRRGEGNFTMRPGSAFKPRWTDIVAIFPTRGKTLRRACYKFLADVMNVCREDSVLQVDADIAQQLGHNQIGHRRAENGAGLAGIAVNPARVNESVQESNFL